MQNAKCKMKEDFLAMLGNYTDKFVYALITYCSVLTCSFAI